MEETQEKNNIPLIAGAVVILIFVFGIYLMFGGSSSPIPKNLQEEASRITKELATARQNLQNESNELNDLERAFRAMFPFYGIASDEYKNISSAVSKTDLFFLDANGNPKLKITSKAELQKKINDQRAYINQLLNNWKQKLSASQASVVTRQIIDNLISDAQVIEEYVNDLSSVINLLTPENSGLTQAEIDSYQQILNDVNNQLSSSIANLVVTTTTTQQSGQTQTTTSTQTQTVTAQDLANQQSVVDAAQAQVDALAAQLAQIQALINQAIASSTQPVIQKTSTQPKNVGTQRGDYVPPDLIVQPGPPGLVEGENAY